MAWNERLDHSIYAYCFAFDEVQAQQIVDAIKLPGYINGPVSFLYKRDRFEYPVDVEKIYKYIRK